jgi:hypothetical protein
MRVKEYRIFAQIPRFRSGDSPPIETGHTRLTRTPAGRVICDSKEVSPVIPNRCWIEPAFFTRLTPRFQIPILTWFFYVVKTLANKQQAIAVYFGGPNDGRIFR